MEFKNEPVESEKSEIEKELEDAGTIEDDDKEDIVEAEFEEVEENDRDF